MRPIEFRAQEKDTRKWVYGSYLHDKTLDENDDALHSIWSSEGDGEWHSVDPSTIGQFTGLYDKEGNKIFEGDIISLFNPEWLSDEHCLEVVEFKDGAFWSYEDSKKFGKCYVDDCLGEHMRSTPTLEVQVYGNIHDKQSMI